MERVAVPREESKKKQSEDRIAVLTRQALQAEHEGNYGAANAYLQEAVAAATGDRRVALLDDWCRVAGELNPEAVQDPEPCRQLELLRPGSPAVATRRAKRAAPTLDMESPAKADKAKARPAQAAPASQQSAQ